MSKKRKRSRPVRGLLTIKRIARLSKPGRHLDGHNLYLQVGPSGTKSWLLRYARDDIERWMGLGAIYDIGLEEAREKARQARLLLRDGIDPLQARRDEIANNRRAEAERDAAEAKLKTFAECVTAFLAKHSDGWKNAKHRQQWKNTLETYANPVIGKLFVADIDTPHIVQVLERDDLWTEKRETARRVLGRIERVLNYARASGYRAGDNPAKWTGHLKDLLPANGKTVAHYAALPYDQLPAFLADLKAREGIAARALEFTVLTAARTGETIGALRDEINVREKVWTIPADRMKMAKEHRVPLSDRVLEILKHLPVEDGNEHVFIGPKKGEGLSNMAMDAVMRRMGCKDRATVHGFRSTFMDWAHEQTAFPKVVIDMALAHTIGDKVEAAYRRGELIEKRRKLMHAWAKYCDSKPAARGGEVVPLRRRVR